MTCTLNIEEFSLGTVPVIKNKTILGLTFCNG